MIDPSVVRRRLRKLDELLQRLHPLSEVPVRLEEEGVLGEELAERLSEAAGQRNILVHLYLDVDPEQIFATLRRDLDAFSEFAERIERLL